MKNMINSTTVKRNVTIWWYQLLGSLMSPSSKVGPKIADIILCALM